MESPLALVAVLLACLVLSNKEASKWFFLVSCAYAAFLYWYISVPLLVVVGLIWGGSQFVRSACAKDALIAVAVVGGIVLAVAGFAKLFPNVFQVLAAVFALGFYALMIVGAILGIAFGPAKEQSR